MVTHVLFPEVILAFQQELKNHPDIVEFVHQCGARGDAEVLGAIAAKLDIILDGIYDPVDLCEMLLKRLKQRGQLIIAANDEKLIPVSIELTREPDSDG